MIEEPEEGGRDPEWFSPPVGDLEQGDILFDLTVFASTAVPSGAEAELLTRSTNAVILTQTCDIPKKSQESLLLAEVHDYMTLVSAGAQHLKSSDYRKALARGEAIGEFLIPPDAAQVASWTIVNFRHLHVVQKTLLDTATISHHRRLRLQSPYKEHLSQSFARFMMRVALPVTLHEFERLKLPS